MCGINGFTWPDADRIAAMNRVTRYRGPDDTGTLVDEAVSLGHCRLSIIDLSPRGHQPMANEDESLWLVHNGEIYNYRELRDELVAAGHRFASDTDSEVILHAYEQWGTACLDRFNGMWAFALYDCRRRRLVLARDRFGIKPLYYGRTGRGLVFSSMIGALREHGLGGRPNDRAVMQYLAFNLEQHDEQTFFDGIESLLPGHLLVYDLDSGDQRVERWYTLRARDGATAADLREAFVRSVQRRTVSDVPIGVCLSGGIDSSAITSVLDACLAEPFNTYSLVVPGSPMDESRYIDEMARHARIRTQKTTIEPAVFLDDLRDFVVAMEEPVTGLSAYAQYRVFHLAHEHRAKVLLDGQGGDEILAGYVYYFGYRFWELFARLRWLKLASEMWRVRRHMHTLFPHAMFAFLAAPGFVRHAAWRRRICPWIDHDYLERTCGDAMDPRWKRQTVGESLRQTLSSTSIPHNLVWEDKSSMRWSIESRVPFLDVDVVETAMGLETDDLLCRGETKVAFKRAMADLLPEAIAARKDKVGFEAPTDLLFRDAGVAAMLREVVGSAPFAARPYWRADRLRRMLDDHLAGRREAGETLWKCVNLELWFREFFDGAGSQSGE